VGRLGLRQGYRSSPFVRRESHWADTSSGLRLHRQAATNPLGPAHETFFLPPNGLNRSTTILSGMFATAYLSSNEVDLIVWPDRFQTAQCAQTALAAFRASLGAESSYIPERCIVLEIPDPIRTRFQIEFYDIRFKVTWEGIPSNGKRYWSSEKAARIALLRLIQKEKLKNGQIDPNKFKVEEIPWQRPADSRPPCGRYGRRVPWKATFFRRADPFHCVGRAYVRHLHYEIWCMKPRTLYASRTTDWWPLR